MAKGEFLSPYQQKIVKRYYENLDASTMQKLAELVSDLFLSAGDAKKSARLWKSAATALGKTATDQNRAAAIIEKHDIQAFAKLVEELGRRKAGILKDPNRS